ncbi:MAG: 50S ribosomal protein L29 [Patescibacteria group bacterium]
MATMKNKDLENKTELELVNLIQELIVKQRNLKFDLKMGKLQNISLLSKTRKQLAQAKTILKMKYGRKI